MGSKPVLKCSSLVIQCKILLLIIDRNFNNASSILNQSGTNLAKIKFTVLTNYLLLRALMHIK